MSRTKEEKMEKKRKRNAELTEDVPKKSKKSKKADDVSDAPTRDAPVEEVAKPKKEKKDKKEKKSKKVTDKAEEATDRDVVAVEADAKKNSKKSKKSKKDMNTTDSAPVADEAELISDMKTSENFISINDDEPMPDADESTEATTSKKDKKKAKKDKGSKKLKTAKEETAVETPVMEETVNGNDATVATNGVDTDAKAAKKDKKKSKEDKKEKKARKDKQEKRDAIDEEVASEEQLVVETNGDATAEPEVGEEGAGADGETVEEGKKGRFIVFVGNLPYSATKEQIEEHFAKIKPTEIRLRTYKGTNKFMGTCFVEFDRFDRMETCLKKYHHSLFPDAKNKKEGGRKINVELSAGGGGNSDVRRERIAAKNDKLHDERARDREKRAELEMKQSDRKDKKESLKKGDKDEPKSEADTFGMNPARLAMMQRPAAPAHRQRY